MRPILPDVLPRGECGLTLIELVLAIVIVGIVVAATVFFAYPVTQSVELTGRASLTDEADNALQRMGREVRLALPNSVQSAGACGASCIEFIPVRTAGRYRTEASGAGCNTTTDLSGSDELAFDVAETCFKSIGTVANASTIVNSGDFLVLNNTGMSGQNAYATSAPLNRVQISQADEQGGARERINFAPFTFQRSLHDSPGRRFFVVTTPVAYDCAGGTLTRYSGYAYGAAYTTGAAAVVANDVASCNFVYVANVSPQIGLLTLQLTLSKALSPTTTETVTLYHSVHVSNVP